MPLFYFPALSYRIKPQLDDDKTRLEFNELIHLRYKCGMNILPGIRHSLPAIIMEPDAVTRKTCRLI